MVLFLRAPIPFGNPRISWVTQGRFYTRGADKSLCGKHAKRSAGSNVLETRNWNCAKTANSMNSKIFKRARVVKMLRAFWSFTCNSNKKQLRTSPITQLHRLQHRLDLRSQSKDQQQHYTRKVSTKA